MREGHKMEGGGGGGGGGVSHVLRIREGGKERRGAVGVGRRVGEKV